MSPEGPPPVRRSGSLSRLRSLGLLIPVVLMTAACSLAFVHGPDAESSGGAGGCTESWLLPALDVAAAAIGVRGAIVARGDVVADKDQRVVFNIGWAAAFATSSAIGYFRVKECRALKGGGVRSRA